jgi:hypothetical protein
MSRTLILVTTGIYIWIAIDQLSKRNYPMFTCYAGYAFANAGLYAMASH